MSRTDHRLVEARPEKAWHGMNPAEVASELATDNKGLTQDEAERRLQRHGPNALPHAPPPSLWAIAGRQFRSPLIYVLAIAAAVSLALGEVKDAAFIVGVLLINAIIGTIQEGKAEKASQAL
ncbi:MAG: cation-transporting P-type ATPase, partial [Gammaproteobacteria bacterium]